MEPVKKMAEIFPAMKKAMLKTEHRLKITPVKDEFKLYNRDVVITNSKAEKFLKVKSGVYLKTGLKITVDWLDMQGISS